jgi:hypothetical protein
VGIWHSTHIAYGIKLINFCLLYCCVGNVRVFCRVRPQFEDEGPVVTAFPDDFTLRINQSMAAAPVKEFEFDHVYGPHVSQGMNLLYHCCGTSHYVGLLVQIYWVWQAVYTYESNE